MKNPQNSKKVSTTMRKSAKISPNRKPIPPKTRFKIFKRDEFKCQYCGRTPPNVILEVDHIIPIKNGGGNEEMNLLTACWECNRGKAAKSLNSVPEGLNEQIQRETERLAQVKQFNKFLMEQRKYIDQTITRIGRYWYDNFISEKGKNTFNREREASIRLFLSKLPEATILNAVDIAMRRKHPYSKDDENTFKYFCGICWKEIKGSGQGCIS